MKTLILLAALLAGCATTDYNPNYVNTAVGSELPAFVDWCDKADAAGRCVKWHNGNGQIRQP